MVALIKTLLFTFTMFVLGCGNTQYENQSQSSSVLQDTLEVINIDEVITWCPRSLDYLNNHLVIINNCKDSLLQLVDLENMTTEMYAPKGEGPEEFLYLRSHGQIEVHQNSRHLRLIDSHKRKAYLFGTENHKKFVDEKKLPREIVFWKDLLHLGDQDWIYSPLNSTSFITIFRNDELSKDISFFPEVETYYSNDVVNYAYYNITAYDNERNKIVSALRYFPGIVIFNDDGDKLHTYLDEYYKEPEFRSKHPIPTNNPMFYYNNVKTTKNYIYAMNYNVSFEAFQKDESKTRGVLEVFDWELNLMAVFHFDRPIGNITIDVENMRIYGFSTDFDEHALCKINIPVEYYRFFSL